MDVLPIIGASFVVAGLLFFIFYNAVRTANFLRRAIFFAIFGIVLLIGLSIGIIKDYNNGLIPKFTLSYFTFPLVILIFTLFFIIYYLVNAKRYHHQLRSFKHRAKKTNNEYLYLIYKYEDCYLLEIDDVYRGIIVRFDKDVYFRDDMIERVVATNKLDVKRTRYCGTVNSMEKKKRVTYYCYEIEVNSLNSTLENYKQINRLKMPSLFTNTFHKNIIFRMLLNEQFNIEE